MLCLDSDILIAFLRKKPEALNFIKEHEPEGYATTTINQFELLIGAKISKKKDENILNVRDLTSRLTILNLGDKEIENCSDIYAELHASGQIIEIRDLLIAGMCRQSGVTLVTRNETLFRRISGLNVVAW
jgi:tRNA(fMet)-specific endonuclease VapC